MKCVCVVVGGGSYCKSKIIADERESEKAGREVLKSEMTVCTL